MNRYNVESTDVCIPVFNLDTNNGRWVRFEDVENILRIHEAIDFLIRKGIYCDEWSSAGMWNAVCV